MRIANVSIEGDLDDFGGRALIVNTDSEVGTFKTPNRAMTSFEFQYKSQLPFRPTLKNQVSEIVERFYGDKWIKFTSTNGSFYRRKNNLSTAESRGPIEAVSPIWTSINLLNQ